MKMNEIYLQNGKKVWLERISTRKFKINTSHSNTEVVRDSKGEFIELKFSDMFSFKKGDEVPIKNDEFGGYVNYIINDVFPISRTEFEGIEEKPNMTSIFILPLLEFTHIYFEYSHYMYTCYISEDYKTLYTKYKFNNSQRYLNLEERLAIHPDYLGLYDYSTEVVFFKFLLKDEFKDTIDKIIEGKYSKIPDNIKDRILRFHGLTKSSKLGGILYKHEEYRKFIEGELGLSIPGNLELMSKSSKEKEIWNLQSYSQKIGTKF